MLRNKTEYKHFYNKKYIMYFYNFISNMVKSNYFTILFTPSLFGEIQPNILSFQQAQFFTFRLIITYRLKEIVVVSQEERRHSYSISSI